MGSRKGTRSSTGPAEFVIKVYRGNRGWKVGIGELSRGSSHQGLIVLKKEFTDLGEAERAGKQYLKEQHRLGREG